MNQQDGLGYNEHARHSSMENGVHVDIYQDALKNLQAKPRFCARHSSARAQCT